MSEQAPSSPASPHLDQPHVGRIGAHLISQFQRPRGLLGRLAGRIMAARGANVDRNLWLVELLELSPDHRVLEIGPGPGVGLAAVAKTVTAGQLVGVDHSDTMLSQAKTRNRELVTSGRLTLCRGAAERLPDELGRFDRVYCMNVWQFWADQTAVIAGLADFVTTGGRLAIGYQPRHPGAPDVTTAEQQIRGDLLAAGFTTVSTSRMDIEPPVIAVIGS